MRHINVTRCQRDKQCESKFCLSNWGRLKSGFSDVRRSIVTQIHGGHGGTAHGYSFSGDEVGNFY